MPFDNDNNNDNGMIKLYLCLFPNRHEIVDSYSRNRVFYKLYTNIAVMMIVMMISIELAIPVIDNIRDSKVYDCGAYYLKHKQIQENIEKT